MIEMSDDKKDILNSKSIKNYLNNIMNNTEHNSPEVIILYNQLFHKFLSKLMDNWAKGFVVKPCSIDVAIYGIFLYKFNSFSRYHYHKAILFLHEYLFNDSFANDVTNLLLNIGYEQTQWAQEVSKTPYPNYEIAETELFNLICNKANDVYYDND